MVASDANCMISKSHALDHSPLESNTYTTAREQHCPKHKQSDLVTRNLWNARVVHLPELSFIDDWE
jgi:hypothetical protein